MRVAVITPIPTPYRDPFWGHVAAQAQIELDVYYCAAGKSDRPWSATWPRDFRWEVLPGRNLLSWRGADDSCYWNRDVTGRLAAGRYDAIIVGGYNHPTMLSAIAFAQRRQIPYFMMCETYQRRASGLKSVVKRAMVGRVMRRAAGTFPTGRLSGEYVVSYGARPERVVPIPNVPDVETLSAESARLRDEHEDGRPTVLFVGRLIPKKRAGLLLRAFAGMRGSPDARLVIVGDGPERSMLEQQARELQIGERVTFTGFRQPAEVIGWYSRASVYVMPSSETWGVSVIEALSCGAPVIVSDGVGCHPDVVTDDRVGQVVRAGDEAELRSALESQLGSRRGAAEVRTAWESTRCSFRYEVLAERLAAGVRQGMTAS